MRGDPGIAPTRKKSILIAEDEPNIVLSLEYLFKAAGYYVAIARDGPQVLALARTLHPDLIVLDIMLPGINGFELCRWLRNSQEARHTKILMLTARGSQSEMEKGLAAGADAYVTKPFATKELVSKVAALLEAESA